MNASGTVVGEARGDDPFGQNRAFVYADGAMKLVPTPAGHSIAYGINARGDIVGTWQQRAFVYASGVLRLFGDPARSTHAYAINDSGTITGARYADEDGTRAFVYHDATLTALGTLGGNESQAFAINTHGDVVGFSEVDARTDHAFVQTAGEMRSLGTLGGPYSIANAINDRGQIVGWSMLSGHGSRAFVYDSSTGGLRALGTLGGEASAAAGVNNHGHVVGQAQDAMQRSRPFLHRDGQMYDLNVLVVAGLEGGELIEARAINDAGQVLANGRLGIESIPFRLDPVEMAIVDAIEYHHAAFDHYFATALRQEIAALDRGDFPGWTRTGEGFRVLSHALPGTRPVCRFFSTSFGTRSSHFYTLDTGECELVKRNSAWQYEGVVFHLPPTADGTCPAGSRPLYRLYNGGRNGAPNHRYTTNVGTRAAMLALGWISEGLGATGVVACTSL